MRGAPKHIKGTISRRRVVVEHKSRLDTLQAACALRPANVICSRTKSDLLAEASVASLGAGLLGVSSLGDHRRERTAHCKQPREPDFSR